MNKNIKYLNRDFDSIINKLVDYTKYYYPNSFNDFSPASPGMIMLQLMAYVGDVLNFYIDKQTKQSILYYAQQKESIYNIAQSYGYKIKKAIPSSVQLTFRIIVPVLSDDSSKPNLAYAPIFLPGTVVGVSNKSNTKFRIVQQINFKKVSNQEILPVYIQQSYDKYKILQKKVIGYSLNEKTVEIECDSQISDNLKLTLPNQNIIKIIDVVDDNGNKWYQVSNLANDTVIDYDAQYQQGVKVFKRKKTNKRFKFLIDIDDIQYMYFGSKQTSNILNQNLYKSFYEFDTNQLATPASMILNNNYGQVPTDTVLSVKYLVSDNVQVESNQIDTVIYSDYHNNNIVSQREGYNEIINSLIVFNQKPSSGGQSIQPLQSIKQNAISLINTQNRLVTAFDYQKAISLMPSQYGQIYKSYVKMNEITNKVQIYVIGKNINGQLVNIPDQVKVNIGQFLQKYRILGSRFQIKDAFIINVKCNFNIVVNKQYSKQQVLYDAIQTIKEYMNIDNFEIGSYINTNQIRNTVLSIQGVSNIIDQIQFQNIYGDQYSLINYNMQNALKNGKYYTSIKPSIFEIKYPEIDIKGRAL